MGKVDFGINIAKRTANFVKACGKESILATKPQALKGLQIDGLKLAAPIRADVCTFAKDPSLAPELLGDLLKVKGSQSEKVMQIKDRFLRAMGYKNPELVKLTNFKSYMDLSVDFYDGSLSVGQRELPVETLVAALRHECDHIDKFAKLVKAEGFERAEDAFYRGLLRKHIFHTRFVDRKFWLKFSKDADITNFNSKKYLEALENYRYDFTCGSNSSSSSYDIYNMNYLYCTNEFEKSAYAYTKKVLKHYGVDDTTMYDICTKPFVRIKNLLKSYGEKRNIYEPKGFKGANTFNQLYGFAISKTEPLGVEHLKYLRDVANQKITPNPARMQQIAQDINAIEQRCASDGKRSIKVLDTVYDWLKQEKFTLNDIDLG